MFVYEAICYDLNGQTIDYFTQWDTNQKIVIRLEGCGDDYHIESGELQTVPEVHFTNIKRDTALAVKATLDGNDIVVDVPNLILEEPYPVLIYVWYTNKEYPNSQSTIARTEIAVRQKNKPHDYYYVENITTVTAEAIKQEVHDRVSKEAEEKINNDVADLKAKVEKQLSDNNDRMTVINERIAAVNASIESTDNNIAAVNERMAAIETSFSDTTTEVNNALEDISDLREFKNQYDAESNVISVDVEKKTVNIENLNVSNSMRLGRFIWVVHPDDSLSLQWIEGDE